MISKIFLARLEPCFQAKKTKSGEVSRVKKENSFPKKIESKPINVDKTPKTDTFTAAQSDKRFVSPKGEVNSKTK